MAIVIRTSALTALTTVLETVTHAHLSKGSVELRSITLEVMGWVYTLLQTGTT